jgi:hypothetical protein
MLQLSQMVLFLISGMLLFFVSSIQLVFGQLMNFEYSTQWGSAGEANGQFNGHNDVDFYNGSVIVADYANHRIQIFDPEGNFISKFGDGGEGDGQFHKASALSLDPEGNIYVADQFNFRVQKFTNDGKFITSGGLKGKAMDNFCIHMSQQMTQKESYL